MIYACLRFLQEWATPLTVVNFTLLGAASGFSVAAALAALDGLEAAPGSRWPRSRSLRSACSAAAAVAAAQCAPAAQVDARHGDRHQASAHRAARRGFSRRFVQYARVLSRPHGCVPAGGQMELSGWRVRPAAVAADARPGAGRAGLVRRRAAGAVRRPVGGALVLLRRGESSAEPLLPRARLIWRKTAGERACVAGRSAQRDRGKHLIY